ncbi:MAG: valine--tRNA ligase [Candidatus Megaira endosymbiont of Mesostigma viride]|nr:MAG: valine--tRNA ligase [Candidatus Megaira endosymbiont of Mesostigma viride]HJK88420.1 valine--tRNA ligase [Candidatus Megaira endosymbiont of Mesostigma viride]
MMSFPKKYKFDESEKKWQIFWQENAIYHWSKSEARENSFIVDTPPPGVSGQLHIGHVYSYTHTDFIVRHRRMKGKNVFYPMGFDDNGLPTERLVEKEKNIRANSVSRKEFINICNEVIAKEETKFRALFNRIALSVDWNLEYQTINPLSCKISQMSFLDLIEKGQIYRDSQPMLWDSVDQTALAQAEIEDREKVTFMNDILFSLENGDKITIATTRPELLPACVSVFFHPEDKRYNYLEGQFAFTPLFNVKVPLLADDMVDPEKGTGLVMCCTFGDQTDIAWWRKHKLPTNIIISKQGRIENIQFDNSCANKIKAEQFAAQLTGLTVTAARSKIIELLKKEGLLVNQVQKLQTVKCAERSGAPLEILTTPQWFIKTIIHKEALLKKSDELNWYPKFMKIKLDRWIEGIGMDWCISRQRYFGVPFPVWYSKRAGEEGKPIFAKNHQLPVDPLVDLPEGYNKEEVIPDYDVMDTWATSSVSPQLNSHGVSNNHMVDENRYKKLFPADLRPQAHEILRTWAFYTMLKAYLHENTLPWKDIMVSGWCLAQDKSKMSKSKGNVLIPEILLEAHGSDVIRYWCASSKLGTDTAYSEDVINNGKRLVNKLWNAAKFASTHFDKISDSDKALSLCGVKHKITRDFDKYLVNQVVDLVDYADQELTNYEYATAIDKTEKFFWALFCDNYLEITKTRAYNENGEDDEGALSTHLTLYHTLKTLLQLFAPIVPHITEELFHILYAKDISESIHMRGSWPNIREAKFTDIDETKSEDLLEILELVRKIKAQDNLSIKSPISYIEIEGIKLPDNLISDLKNVTSAKEILYVEQLTSQNQNLQGKNLQINVVY